MAHHSKSAGHDTRQRARSLNAATVSDIMAKASLQFIFYRLTAHQLEAIQRVLDAAVVDPVIEQEAQALYQRGTKYYGSLVVHDAATMRRRERVLHAYIPVGASDKRIRLDYKVLLDANALKPTTDNPDEADYLERVRLTLESRGVWLRFEPKMVRDPEDLSRHIYDIRQYEVWLSLGPDGDAIPTKTGRIDRDSLIGTTAIGAGYWRNVDQGNVQKALKKEVDHLYIEIESGEEQHRELARIRRHAFPGVVAVSDTFGGADFPDQSIWDSPRKFVLKAQNMDNQGHVYGAQAYLVTAAVLTRNAAQLLSRYLDKSTTGAERAVKVLKVAKTAGKVAEVGLAITGVAALARGGVALAGGSASTAAAGDAAVDQAARQMVERYIARNPELARELETVRWVPGPKGSIAGNIKGGHSAGYGEGFQKW